MYRLDDFGIFERGEQQRMEVLLLPADCTGKPAPLTGHSAPPSWEDALVSGIGEPYECEVCHGHFAKTVGDETAMAEMEETWTENADPGMVCDDCYALVSAWAQLDHPELLR